MPCLGGSLAGASELPAFTVQACPQTERSDTEHSDTERSDTERSDTERSDTERSEASHASPVEAEAFNSPARDPAKHGTRHTMKLNQ